MVRYAEPMNEQQQTRLTATVTGTVQGVGFRYYTRKRALALGLSGIASNRADGSVLIVAEGADRAVHELASWLGSAAAPGRVNDVDGSYGAPTGEFTDFSTE